MTATAVRHTWDSYFTVCVCCKCRR